MKEKENKKNTKDNDDKQASPANEKDSNKINIYPHLRQNILQPAKNCKDSLEHAYYCFNCKCSTCEKCSLKNHNGHKLVLKNEYLNFDSITFEETKKMIKDSFNLENNLDSLVKNMEKNASAMHAKIDEIKDKKIKEIKNTYDIAKNNINELINLVNSMEQMIQKFYLDNQNFFNEKKKS